MKKMMLLLFAMLTIAAGANAMGYDQARREALFLTDKMAYELNLNDAQYEAAYEINLDYLMSVTGRNDVFGYYWECRNMDLSYILYTWQWEAFRAATYFYRPLFWEAGYWHFGIYARYPRRDYFYFGHPHFYGSYRGGHSWRSNSGRSYYRDRHSHYRPHDHARDRHHGMRDGWNRGDYRGHGGSSTRVTGGDRGNYRDNGHRGDRGHRGDGNNHREGRTTRDQGGSHSGGASHGGGSHSGGAAHGGGDRGHRPTGSAGPRSSSRSGSSMNSGTRSASSAGSRASAGSRPSGGGRSAGGSHSSDSGRSSNGSVGASRGR